MYVADSLNALTFFPHQVHFETVRDADNARRHNWSPGYYEDADASLEHHVGSAAGVAAAAPPLEATEKGQPVDGELDAVPA